MSAPRKKRRFPVRILIIIGVIAVLGIVFSLVDLRPDLGHLDQGMLSGPTTGNYYPVVDSLGRAAADENGRLRNVSSQGTVDNLTRLSAASDSCDVAFALVQDGVPPPAGSELELVARLRKSESMFVVGRGAAQLERFDQLRGKTIGVGPTGSGTDHLARQVFESGDLKPLALTLRNLPTEAQLDELAAGTLDLGLFVVDEDAEIIRRAVREHGLQLAAFEHWDVIARQHAFLWHGRIGAGQYDPIAMLPPGDRRVLRVDTLVVGNGCASRTETIALLSLLSHEFPGLVEHNQKRGKSEIFALSETADQFFESGGPGLLEQHIPWAVNIMDPSNWVYVVMCISLLMNGMTFWHRFRLWRLDANRDKADQVVRDTLGASLTANELVEIDIDQEGLGEKAVEALNEAIGDYEKLRQTCQKQANSMLVPMGQEGSYRYQEDQIDEMLTAIRALRDRLVKA